MDPKQIEAFTLMIEAITPIAVPAIVAGLALLGVYITQARTGSRAKRDYVCSRFERAYLACQSLYNGHEGEINKLKVVDQSISQKDWIALRNPPGEHMNEIKMLIRMYAPHLKEFVEEMDRGHSPLKNRFLEIDDKFSVIPNPDFSDASLVPELDGNLRMLGRGMDKLKEGLAKAAHKA